jgi:hypothetical protein
MDFGRSSTLVCFSVDPFPLSPSALQEHTPHNTGRVILMNGKCLGIHSFMMTISFTNSEECLDHVLCSKGLPEHCPHLNTLKYHSGLGLS